MTLGLVIPEKSDWGDRFMGILKTNFEILNNRGALNFRGAYVAGTMYNLNDGVTSTEGRSFYCLQDGTLNHAPPTYPTIANAWWSLLAEKGEGDVISAGKAGGQTINGDTAASGFLTLQSTVHATKGKGLTIDSITVGRGVGGISSNIAFGSNALNVNTTGANNVAIGLSALSQNTTGTTNVAIGVAALSNNTIGANNVAIGVSALAANTTGSANMAIGAATLAANTTGASNTAIGKNSLLNADASYNTAIGYAAMQGNTTGANNVAIGYASLMANTTGLNNTAIGWCAGNALTSGSNCLILGYNAQASTTTATNEIILGNANIATLRCQVTSITALSDQRDKANIEDLKISGLDVIRDLRPVKFSWAKRTTDDTGALQDVGEDSGIYDVGFLAQDLAEVSKKYDINWLGLVHDNNPDRLEATPGKLFNFVVKAIQELATRVEALEARS